MGRDGDEEEEDECLGKKEKKGNDVIIGGFYGRGVKGGSDLLVMHQV